MEATPRGGPNPPPTPLRPPNYVTLKHLQELRLKENHQQQQQREDALGKAEEIKKGAEPELRAAPTETPPEARETRKPCSQRQWVVAASSAKNAPAAAPRGEGTAEKRREHWWKNRKDDGSRGKEGGGGGPPEKAEAAETFESTKSEEAKPSRGKGTETRTNREAVDGIPPESPHKKAEAAKKTSRSIKLEEAAKPSMGKSAKTRTNREAVKKTSRSEDEAKPSRCKSAETRTNREAVDGILSMGPDKNVAEQGDGGEERSNAAAVHRARRRSSGGGPGMTCTVESGAAPVKIDATAEAGTQAATGRRPEGPWGRGRRANGGEPPHGRVWVPKKAPAPAPAPGGL